MVNVTVTKIDPVYSDERGVIIDLLNENLGHVGLITTKKGNVRGNHYHKKSIQYSYILSGKFEVLIADFKTPEKIEKIILNAGELITIHPFVIHTFKALENSDIIDMISQSRESTSYESDVVKGFNLQ